MAIRPLSLSVICLSLFASVPMPVRADDASQLNDVEMGKRKLLGVINAGSVYVRSAPRDDAYPAMKLDQGAKLTIVGYKFHWLKIVPPDGAFAYVPKAYVMKRADGHVGRVNREVIAKVGSSLNTLKTVPMGKIDDGKDVDIIGEQDEWYKIKPPEGTYLYVNESFVDLVKPVDETPAKRPEIVRTQDPKTPKAPKNPVVTEKPTKPADPKDATATDVVKIDPAKTEPGKTEVVKTETPGSEGPSVTPTAPEAPAVTVSFDTLETQFKAANEKLITDQPVDSLLAGYTDLLKQDTLVGQPRKVAEVRLATLKLRKQAQLDYKKALDDAQQAKGREDALVAEREEIQQRIKEKQVKFYAAVGTLRASSIQRGAGTLFRLTDPANGRTVAYVRSNDGKYASMIGQFVGVKGTLTTDSALNMKLIEEPAGLETVDPKQIHNAVAAQIIPPSLIK